MKRNVTKHAVTQPPDSSINLIPLTQGQNAIVDAADYDWLMQWKWYAQWHPGTRSFYAVRATYAAGKQRRVFMHRELLGLECSDKQQSDHINHATLDNRRANLRIATSSENNCNKGPQRGNTSGFKGVFWSKARHKWHAMIKLDGHQQHLGYFGTPEAAAEAYNFAAIALHGEFAKLN